MQKRGRSAAFADPARTALQARHVWLPEAGTSVLSANAHSGDTSVGISTTLFPALPALEHILFEANGRQTVVLRGNAVSLQLSVTGADVSAAPVAVEFVIPGLATIRRACDQLATVGRILSTTPRPPALPRWTRATLRLRDAIITLDGWFSGATYRDTAIVLHGRDYVARNWGTGLKDRMRRHLKRGLLLSQLNYRDLLR